jgi:hypothetical protein
VNDKSSAAEYEDVIRHRKKAQHKTPKKSKHKHIFEPCVLEQPIDWHKKEHERSGVIRSRIGYYCPICGKVGEFQDKERWYELKPVDNLPFKAYTNEPTEECVRELDPLTRTLPTFFVDDYFQKFVSINNI